MSADSGSGQRQPSLSDRGLELVDVVKRYGETIALDGLSLSAEAGAILGIAGPNGAGKSTMIRIVAGEEEPDSGAVLLNGEPLSARRAGEVVSVVHQEVQLFPNLTVGENLVAGRGTGFRRPGPGFEEHEVLRDLGIAEHANRDVERCSLVVQQLTEIARTLVAGGDTRVFLFDEPNSALTEEESDRLFTYMHELRDRGAIVLLVSHRLGELEDHADRVVVVRDGKVGANLDGDAVVEPRIAHELVVGQQRLDETSDRPVSTEVDREGTILQVSGWTHADGAFRDIDLTVNTGEIVAVVGVEGSGARELVRSFGGHEDGRGDISVDRLQTTPRTREANFALTAYLPASRQDSLFFNFNVGQNLVSRLGIPAIANRGGILRRRRMAALARKMMSDFRVRAEGPDQPIRALSGGNQQKVAVASAIEKRPSILVVEEPTRGVDVGSKAEIYRLLESVAEEGKAVIAFCTELPEVFEIADRCIVIHRGQIVTGLEVSSFEDVVGLAQAVATASESVGDAPAGSDT